MSLRDDLQEVVRWLADLTAPATEPATDPLSKQDWELVHDAVERATASLLAAQAALQETSSDPAIPSVLAELATDVAHQSEALELRARMLKQRAAPDAEERAAAKVEARQKAKEAAARARAAKEPQPAAAGPGGEPHQPKPAAPQDSPPPEGTALERAVAHINRGQQSLGTANEHLHVVAHLDFAATAFDGELEMLAEMALSLAQQCRRHVSPAKSGTAKVAARGS